MKLPILPTTVIGSYSMPEWLERAKNDYLSRRLSRRDLDEMHDAVRKAAIKDQESAGIDIITDGELQRDNMIDYFTERLPGVQVDLGSKRFYYDFYETSMPLEAGDGIARSHRRRSVPAEVQRAPCKVSVSGPHTLVKRIRNQCYRAKKPSRSTSDAR
jgi:5-methyltetrahydropteroyltriglutamate--homocysteine methyltransferase